MNASRTTYQASEWAKPEPLGYGQSADFAHFFAAPLLTAAAVVLIGVVLSTETDKIRYPGPVLLLLVLAVVALVTSVQSGFHARSRLYSAADVTAWHGEEDVRRNYEALQKRQRENCQEWKRVIECAVMAYNIGVALLGFGVALCLVPLGSAHTLNAVAQWMASGALAIAAAIELFWVFAAPQSASGM